jgi:hypothetical protein
VQLPSGVGLVEVGTGGLLRGCTCGPMATPVLFFTGQVTIRRRRQTIPSSPMAPKPRRTWVEGSGGVRRLRNRRTRGSRHLKLADLRDLCGYLGCHRTPFQRRTRIRPAPLNKAVPAIPCPRPSHPVRQVGCGRASRVDPPPRRKARTDGGNAAACSDASILIALGASCLTRPTGKPGRRVISSCGILERPTRRSCRNSYVLASGCRTRVACLPSRVIKR